MAEEKKGGALKVLVIFFMVFVIFPVTTFAILFVTSDTVKDYTEPYLRKAPGFIGEYFRKEPTQQETDEKVKLIAEHYLSLDTETAIDKLYMIKKDDEALYNDIIIRMQDRSFKKTEDILLAIREREVRKNLAMSIYEEIQQGGDGELETEVARISELDLDLSLKTIKNNYLSEGGNLEYLANVFEGLGDEKTIEILYYIDKDITELIVERFKNPFKEKVFLGLEDKYDNDKNLEILSKAYEVQETTSAIEEIGNINTKSLEDVAKIYSNLSTRKAADLIRKNQDLDFINTLYDAIRKEERLFEKEESIVDDIKNAVTILNDYDKRISEIASIYQNMNSQDVANIIDKMILNDKSVEGYSIEENDVFQVTDAKIAIDILKQMRSTSVSDVLKNLDSRKAAEITRKLTVE